MPISATARQMDVLRFIHGYQQAKDISPSYDEMGAATQRGRASLHDALSNLEARELIRRLPNRARAIEVLAPPAIPRDPDGAPLYFVRGEWS